MKYEVVGKKVVLSRTETRLLGEAAKIFYGVHLMSGSARALKVFNYTSGIVCSAKSKRKER